MRHAMNLTRGSVFRQLLAFSVPILLTNLIQPLYHAADMIFAGQNYGAKRFDRIRKKLWYAILLVPF